MTLITESVKYWDIVNKIISSSKLMRKALFVKNNRTLAQVVVYEMLFGEGLGKSRYAVGRIV